MVFLNYFSKKILQTVTDSHAEDAAVEEQLFTYAIFNCAKDKNNGLNSV